MSPTTVIQARKPIREHNALMALHKDQRNDQTKESSAANDNVEPLKVNDHDLPHSQARDLPVNNNQHSSKCRYISLIIFIISCAIVCHICNYKYTAVDLTNLQQRYPGQRPILWSSIRSLFTKEPSVLLFIHDGQQTKKVETMLDEIAGEVTANVDGAKRPFRMKVDEFTSSYAMKDYGHVIKYYKKHSEGSRVAILPTLNEIPPETAQSLHFICDSYNPVNPEVVIFLTLVADCTGNPTDMATDALKHHWGPKLHRDVIEPLLVRVTDNVIPLS